ncbi:MAG: PEP-CTERM sorting domain-containing protein, partial [Planctomycetota bacterium]
TLTFTRNLADELEVTVDFLGNSLTRVDDTPQSFDFGMLALGSSSGAFGSSNSAGDPDNGIDITNVSVDYTPIPEPGTLALGLLGGLTILARRR